MKIVKNFIVFIMIFVVSSTISIKINKKDDNSNNHMIGERGTAEAIYNQDSALTFTKNLAKIILKVPNDKEKEMEFMRAFEKCFAGFNDNPAEYEPYLRSFYMKCFELRKEPEKNFKTDVFHNLIMTKLATLRIKYHGEPSTCQLALPYNPMPDKDAIAKIFKSYFKDFVVTPTNAKPFLTSMYSVHRDKLPENSFVNMNVESGSTPTIMYPTIEKSSGAVTKQAESPKITNKMSNIN